MKKITLILLVAILPILTVAQKRGKKSKAKTEQIDNGKASYEFMVIIGIEKKPIVREGGAVLNSNGSDYKRRIDNKIKISFDFGGPKKPENIVLYETKYRSMAHAVNSAAKSGWEFINANVLNNTDQVKEYYYYMKKQK